MKKLQLFFLKWVLKFFAYFSQTNLLQNNKKLIRNPAITLTKIKIFTMGLVFLIGTSGSKTCKTSDLLIFNFNHF